MAAGVGALTLAAATLVSPVRESRAADFATLTVRIDPPVPLSYDDTVVGRARHSVRIEVSNPTSSKVALDDVLFRFVPVKDGVAYTCKTVEGEADRWPKTLDPGEKVEARRSMICETPLVGRYDVQVKVRRATPAEKRGADIGARAKDGSGGGTANERVVGSFPLILQPGSNPPKQVPWAPALVAMASATRDMRPADPPPKVIVGVANGSRQNVMLTNATLTLHVKRRGGTDAPCEDQVVPLAFEGTLAPGESTSLPTTLACALKSEGIYEVVTTLSDGKNASVRVAELAVRVSFIPTPVPMYRPQGPLRPDPHP